METIRVMLSGGPAEIETVQQVDSLDQVLKFHRGNGYEHFRYSGETALHGEESFPLFSYSGRTKVAE